MWSLLVITSIIVQSAVAIFLLNGVRTADDTDKHLRAMLFILLVHLSTKFLLLAVLKNQFLYAKLPTGFSLAYGPLLLIIARGILGRPVSPRNIFLQFIPFLVFSLVYVFLVIAGAMDAIARPAIIGYVRWYEWLVLASNYGYPIYVKSLLRADESRKTHLVRQIANILLVCVSVGFVVSFFDRKVRPMPGFDLRLVPYIFLSAIPILILRYRLQLSAATPLPVVTTPAISLTLPIANTTAAATMTPAATMAPAATTNSAATMTSEIMLSEIPLAGSPSSADPIPADRRYEKSGLDAGKMDEYEAALAVFMRKSKIYLDADLSLEGLASRMKMSRHHLTQLLNERIMKNFYSYINEYRITEAIDRLNNPALPVNILSLAFDCGFNSRSSFNSYFKKITGQTPSAYRSAAAAATTGARPAGGGGKKIIRDISPST